MSKQDVLVIRINPFSRTIARLPVTMSDNPSAGAQHAIQKLCRASAVGHTLLGIEIDDMRLRAVGGLNVDPSEPKWKLAEDGDPTTGIGLVVAEGANRRGLVSVPIDVDWIKERIIWVPGEVPEDGGGEVDREQGEAAGSG